MNNIYDIVAQVFAEHNQPMDDFVEEVAIRIWEDNGEELSVEEIRELAEQFLEEDTEETIEEEN